MDATQKIEILGESAKYDLCGSCFCSTAPRVRGAVSHWIYPAIMPDGKKILLLKVLLSNACENDCYYCVNRNSRDFPRMSFQPEELSRLFMNLVYQRRAQGLFLSSAVSQGVASTMERMIKTVEILRLKYFFKGYIHLKVLPGASFDYVVRAFQLADRVSVNFEAPNPDRLRRITRMKNLEHDILTPMKWISELRKNENHKYVGQTTQFVVGAAGESDQEILKTTEWLYQKLNLTRAYFSAFQPVPRTPLEEHPGTPLIREHRLYQADFLFRRYSFRLNEIPFDSQGNLPLDDDPKMLWALKHPERFPIEINKASKEDLLRVPGIGPVSAARIVRLRVKNKFSALKELKSIGVVVKRAASFILINGKPQQEGFQLSLTVS